MNPAQLRLAAWAGVAFAVLSGAILVLSPFWPPVGASSADVADYYRAHRTPFLIGNYLALIAIVPSFIQGAVFVQLVKRDGDWLWLATLMALIVAHALGGLALTVYQAVPFSPALSDFAGVAFGIALIGLAAFALFASWAALATGALPRVYGQLGIAVALICLVGSLGSIVTEPAWLAGGGLFSCAAVGAFTGWNTLLSVLMLRKAAGPGGSVSRAG